MREEINRTQNERIQSIEDKNYVDMKTGITVLSILVAIMIAYFGFIFNYINNLETKVDRNDAQYIAIEAQLSQIQTDISWIKREFNSH